MIDLALASTERLLNALLEESTSARERAAALDGKGLGLHLTGPEIEIVLRAESGRLHLERAAAESADASLRGTPIGMLEAWRRGKEGILAARAVRFAGDAQVLEQFVELLDLARPDLEDQVSRVTGDVVAHETFRAAHALHAWASRALGALGMNTAEYLQEESRDLPARHEAEAFYADVETLRDDADRAIARAERLLVARRRDGAHDPREEG